MTILEEKNSLLSIY